MQSIGNSIHYSMMDKKVVYITAETFINEFIHGIGMVQQSLKKGGGLFGFQGGRYCLGTLKRQKLMVEELTFAQVVKNKY